MTAIDSKLCGRLFQLILVVILASSVGCKAWPDGDDQSDLGPKIGLELMAGWQKLEDGEDQNNQPIYTRSAIGYGVAVYSFSWGMEADQVYFEPAFYLGSGSGRVDNGKLLGVADAEFSDYDGNAVGGGFKSRIALADSLIRVGLDTRFIQFSGESDFKADGLPGLTEKYDGETKNLEILAVLDYNDPHFRPFIAGGFSGFFNEFESKPNPGTEVKIDPRNPFGLKVGLEFHHIGDSGFCGGLELGYFGGPQIKLSTGYRF